MTRHNFSPKTKRLAYARSGGRCEAVGPRWGHAPGVRCNADLAVTGAEHDHWPLGAHAEGSNTVENDVVCCPACNQYAANHGDKQREQKIKNLSYDQALHDARMARKTGIDVADPEPPRGRQSKKKPIRSAPFRKGGKTQWPKRSFGRKTSGN